MPGSAVVLLESCRANYNFTMSKFVAMLQLLGSLLLFGMALATALNLLLIITRPETISVVNTLIGQGLVIICLIALGRILLRRALRGLRTGADSKESV